MRAARDGELFVEVAVAVAADIAAEEVRAADAIGIREGAGMGTGEYAGGRGVM